MSVVSKFNCMYCGRPIAINYSAAFPPKEQTNGDEVDPPVPGGYRGDQSPALTQSELETVARQHGADPDRIDYSGCSDYRPEDNRLEQTGQGWAEPPDDEQIALPHQPVMNAFEYARQICRTWLNGKDLTAALQCINNQERSHYAPATEASQTTH